MKISILTTFDSLLLNKYLDSFQALGIEIDSIIHDSLGLSEKNLKIIHERTGNQLKSYSPEKYESLQIPNYFVENHNSDASINLIKDRGIDILINAGTPRILRSQLLGSPKIGVLNCHPGLLPMFRGCTCVEWAIYLDEAIGNTVHFMDEKIDEGPILLKEEIGYFPKDLSYQEIRMKVYTHNIELMARGVDALISGKIKKADLIQQEEGRYFKVIEPEKMEDVLIKIKNGKYKYQLTV